MMNGNRKAILVQMRRQRRARRSNGKSNFFSLALKIMALVVVASISGALMTMGVGVGSAVAAYTALTKDLPDPSQIEARFQRANSEFFETTKIYDRTGKTLLYEVIDLLGKLAALFQQSRHDLEWHMAVGELATKSYVDCREPFHQVWLFAHTVQPVRLPQ